MEILANLPVDGASPIATGAGVCAGLKSGGDLGTGVAADYRGIDLSGSGQGDEEDRELHLR